MYSLPAIAHAGMRQLLVYSLDSRLVIGSGSVFTVDSRLVIGSGSVWGN